MINANKEFLNSFFSSNLQYVVPFFQRSYVWNEENWEILWENISAITNKFKNHRLEGEHFIGTLITKQQIAERINEDKRDLIDGQQRLTTVSLLLKAISTKATGEGTYKNLKDQTNDLIVFEDSKGEKFLRIEHSKIDKEYFETVMLDKDLPSLENCEHKILQCYNFFLGKLSDHTDEKLDKLKTSILKCVPVVSMLLEANDDEQEIFDTINSLGVKLTTGELLKNYIFKEKELQGLYDEYWNNVFEEDEERIDFWNENKTSGRVRRTNIEVFLYCYLIIKTNSDKIKLEKLFNQYKIWLKDKNKEEKKSFLKELKEYADIYYNFPEGTELNEISFSYDEKRLFHIIENLSITTVYPLILFLYKNVKNKDILINILKILESYLVRRNVCRYTTKNYNNLFIQIISKLNEENEITDKSFKKILTNYTEDTNKFPDDTEFRNAFFKEPISNSNSKEILFNISLYQIYNPKNDIIKLSSSSYTVEHIMPKKWEKNWGGYMLDENAKYERNKKIKTLGNLTLVTKSLNSSMKNAAWKDKKKSLKSFSLLKITTDYIGYDEWNESKIIKRAINLSKDALKIWR